MSPLQYVCWRDGELRDPRERHWERMWFFILFFFPFFRPPNTDGNEMQIITSNNEIIDDRLPHTTLGSWPLSYLML